MYAGHFDLSVPMLGRVAALYERTECEAILDGIAPRTGDALWFQHAVLHAGKHVTRGTEYVLRTDVLYR